MTTVRDSRSPDCRWSLDTGQAGSARGHREAWTAALAAAVQTWREGNSGPVNVTVEGSRVWLAPALDEHRCVDLTSSAAAVGQLLHEVLLSGCPEPRCGNHTRPLLPGRTDQDPAASYSPAITVSLTQTPTDRVEDSEDTQL